MHLKKSSIGDAQTKALLDACLISERRIAQVLVTTQEESTRTALKFPLLVLRMAIELYGKGDQDGKEKSEKESF